MRGGSKAVWNFSKISSNLVAGSFPYMSDVLKSPHLYTSSLIQPLGKAGHSNLLVGAPASILTKNHQSET